MNCSRIPKSWGAAALVVAHPDDEILWFSSCVECVSKVVVSFHEVDSKPHWTEGRERAIERFPLKNAVFLRLKQAEVFDTADWPTPIADETGVRLSKSRARRPYFSDKRYRQNFFALRDELRQHLEGCKVVLTHNPWGEYGHEEHIQVFNAVLSLKEDLGFELWCNNYLSNKSQTLFSHWVARLDPDFVKLRTESDIAAQIKKLYSKNGCWTWFPDYQWPEEEAFFRVKGGRMSLEDFERSTGTPDYGVVFPLNYIRVAWAPRPVEKFRRLRSVWGRFRRLAKRFSG